MVPKIEAADAFRPSNTLSSDPDWSREVYLLSARGFHGMALVTCRYHALQGDGVESPFVHVYMGCIPWGTEYELSVNPGGDSIIHPSMIHDQGRVGTVAK